MKPIPVLHMILALLVFFALAASVSADGDKEKKKDPFRFALIPAYLSVAIPSLIFVSRALWRIIHNWGSWKIHTPSPRPQCLRTSLGWVDRETLELRQAKRAKRKKAKRDQQKVYRTTKANYKWIFHDPTRELQQRFDDQKERSHLRLLPSWMRSYPHGTLQSGMLANISASLQHCQLDGKPMSGALHDPYRLPDLPIMDWPDALVPGAPEKSCLLPKVPMMCQPNVIQIWHIREAPLPERMGLPPLESEQELNGEVDAQATVIRRDTEHRLREGRPRERMNEFASESSIEVGGALLPIFTPPVVRSPPVFSRQPVRDTPGPEARSFAVRRQRYVRNIERHIQEIRNDPRLMLVRGSLDELLRELRRATGAGHRHAPIASRPPVRDPTVPESVRQARRHQQYIEELESSIDDLRSESTITPVRGRLDSLMHELRAARATRDRLAPIPSLRPAVPSSQGQLQSTQVNQLPTPIQSTAAGFQPRPRVIPGMWRFGATIPGTVEVTNLVDRLHRLTIENLQNWLRDLQNHMNVLNIREFVRTVDAFNSTFQGLTSIRANLALIARLDPAHPVSQRLLRNIQNIQNINTSNPTLVTPVTHGEANRAVIEGPATGDDITSTPTSEEEVHGRGGRAVTQGPTTDDTSGPIPTSEEDEGDVRPDTQHSIAALLLRSVPDHDATLDQADPTAQPHLEYEETIRAQASHQTAAFHTEMGRSGLAPDDHVQDVEAENGATPINTVHSPSSSIAALSNSTATATQASDIARLALPNLVDALNEELYTDAYP